jgi:uncharacterized DUF497 family protein
MILGGRGRFVDEQISAQYSLKFEFDENKSASNREKHGIDFEEAKVLWNDKDKIILDSAFKEEPRSVLIASLSGKIFVAVYTLRSDAIRIISVRRAHVKEAQLYEQINFGRRI